MYNTIEFFNDNGKDLKDILKSCIYNYYLNYKNTKNELSDSQNHLIIEMTNNKVSSEKKGEKNE